MNLPEDSSAIEAPPIANITAIELHEMRAQRDRALKQLSISETKYSQLMAGIAKAVVVELRAAKYIEVHTEPPARRGRQSTPRRERNS